MYGIKSKNPFIDTSGRGQKWILNERKWFVGMINLGPFIDVLAGSRDGTSPNVINSVIDSSVTAPLFVIVLRYTKVDLYLQEEKKKRFFLKSEEIICFNFIRIFLQ